MKRLIYGMMVVLITAISCEKNDIKGYNEAPRLEFFNTKASCVFDDRDYMNLRNTLSGIHASLR